MAARDADSLDVRGGETKRDQAATWPNAPGAQFRRVRSLLLSVLSRSLVPRTTDNRSVHSTLTPANLMTLAHFAVSSAMKLPNSVGVIGLGSTPKARRCAFRFESAR